MLPRKTSITIATLVFLLAVLPRIPGLNFFPVITAAPLLRLTAFGDLKSQSTKVAVAKPLSVMPPASKTESGAATPATAPNPASQAIPFLDVPPGSMSHFLSALQRTARKEPGAVTRILHYGDSPTTADLITSDVRAQLQARFGDAGHGFYLIAPPWAWYGHRDIKVQAQGWKIEPASLSRAKDGVHGLGGVSFRGSAGATSSLKFPAGHTRVTLYYFAQPEAGTLQVNVAGQTVLQLATTAAKPGPGFADFALPETATEFELRVLSGQVRLFGYRLDKPGPGVQYSSLGINGAQVQMIVRYFEVGQWTAELQHENPDLVILNYGTNESLYPAYLDKDYPKELKTVIERVRAAVPQASLLLMSPMDRGVRGPSGDITTPPALLHLVQIQRRVAAETGCAFFNTFEAMGGEGTMGRWTAMKPRLVSADYMHPLPAGAAKVGTLFEQALTALLPASVSH